MDAVKKASESMRMTNRQLQKTTLAACKGTLTAPDRRLNYKGLIFPKVSLKPKTG